MKGKRISALATASLMAMTALATMPQLAMADEEKTFGQRIVTMLIMYRRRLMSTTKTILITLK